MKNNFVFFTAPFVFLFILYSAHAQSDSLLSVINDLAENETYLVEQLLELEETPVNINTADKDALLVLPLLTPQMADSIIARRNRYGHYKSKRQLRPVIGQRLYGLLKTYIRASQKKTYNGHITIRNIYTIERIQEIETGIYKGDALYNYSRIKYQPNRHLSLGFVSQKDPGENNYLDHYNLSLQYKDPYWHVVLGDFYLQFGQGLSHNNPYGNQKSIYLAAVFREPSQIGRSNLTSSESSGKFGLFAQHCVTKELKLFSFYSRSNRDKQISGHTISHFRFDGFHRSQSELDSKNTFYENNWGGGLHFNFYKTWRICAFYNTYTFNKHIENSFALLGDSQKRRQYFNFSGKALSQAALSYDGQYSHFKISGEVSASNKGRPGWAQSLYYSNEKISFGFKYWYLNNDFQTIDGRSFDSNAAFPKGVKGFFCGMTLKLNAHNSFSAFKKYAHHLWRSYFNPMPTNTNEWLLQWDSKIEHIYITCRFRSRTSEDFATIQNISQRMSNNQKKIRIQIHFKPLKKLNGRTRWEHTRLQNRAEKGTLFFQELNFYFNKKLSLNSRFTFFYTTSFLSRIYEYERDVPGAFSNVALFGNGNKMYVLLKWKVLQNFSLWFKWRYISKNDVFANGKNNKVLSRDIRLQIQSLF